MTRIIALLSWYDENPAWLTRCIHSLQQLPTDVLVAVDGAYQHFPDPQPTSPLEQSRAVTQAAEDIDIPLLWAEPRVWPTEVDKRNHMFATAESIAIPGDWYFVIDSDEHVTQAPPDLHQRLQHSPFDVGATTLLEPTDLGPIIYPTHPKFFRAIPGLRTVGDHFTYTTPDGRRLWGDQRKHRLEARDDVTQVQVTHAKNLRHSDRRNAAETYYRTRDELGLEDLPKNRYLTA